MAISRRQGGAAAAAAVAAAGAAAGYFFYASKSAEKNRKAAARWASSLKGEVVQGIKKAGTMDRKTVVDLVDKAARAYATVRSIDAKDLERATRELRNNWKLLASEAGGSKPKPTAKKKRTPTKSVPRVARKTARKKA